MLGPDKPTPVHFGKGLNPILSNLWPHPITFEGRTYKSIEGAYQGNKCGYRPGYENLDGLAAWRQAQIDGSCGKKPDLLYSLMKQRWESDAAYRLELAKAGRITHPVGDRYWADMFPRLLYKLREEMAHTLEFCKKCDVVTFHDRGCLECRKAGQ